MDKILHTLAFGDTGSKEDSNQCRLCQSHTKPSPSSIMQVTHFSSDMQWTNKTSH